MKNDNKCKISHLGQLIIKTVSKEFPLEEIRNIWIINASPH